MEIYVVKSGDSLYSIASLYHTTTDSIAYVNQIPPPFRLVIGQSLLIPVGESSQLRKTVLVNGFAYPYISRYVLGETLPYLTELSVFSYGFTPDGDLIPPKIDDSFMISMAQNQNTAPMLCLTPLGPDGHFNDHLITEILSKNIVKINLINQLLETIQSNGFQGVNIDFEYIAEGDKEAYVEFVSDVTKAVNEIGYPVSVDLAPKTSDSEANAVNAGLDYAALGQAANRVLLMTYEWGYTYPHHSFIAINIQTLFSKDNTTLDNHSLICSCALVSVILILSSDIKICALPSSSNFSTISLCSII